MLLTFFDNEYVNNQYYNMTATETKNAYIILYLLLNLSKDNILFWISIIITMSLSFINYFRDVLSE